MEYTVFYPTPLSEIDPKDDNLDVCVTFADGQNCTFVFATPQPKCHRPYHLYSISRYGIRASHGCKPISFRLANSYRNHLPGVALLQAYRLLY